MISVKSRSQTLFNQANIASRRVRRDLAPAAILLSGLVLAWETAVRGLSISPVILPGPTRITATIWERRELLASDMRVTFVEVVLGFGAGFLAGVILAGLIVYSRVLERALYPLAVGSQTIPVFAIAPLLVIWFGFGILPKIIVAALIVFFPITVNTVQGLRSAEPEMTSLLQSLSASRWTIFRLVQIPAATPYVVAGTQVGITYSVIGAVIGEWVGATKGLGARMLSANSLLQTDLVFASIIVLSTLALTLFVLITVVGRLLTPWKQA